MLKYVLALLTVVFIGAMLFFAVTPNPSEYIPVKASDKVLHATEFFFFTLLLALTLWHYKVENYYMPIISVILVLAFITEGLQLYTKARSFSIYDMGADILGSLLALGIVKGIEVLWKSSKRSS